MQMLATILIAVAALTGTTAFHYEVMTFLDGALRARTRSIRPILPLILMIVVVAHLIEIGFYTAIFALAAGPLGLGAFHGVPTMGAIEYFYFSAQTYSTVGYGDIVPTGDLRILAGVAPLNGLLLLAWSGAFLYNAVHQRPVHV